MNLRLSAQAEADLIEIYQTGVRAFGAEVAERYFDRIERAISIIADTPELARLRHEISPPVRIHPVESHVIVYLTDECGVRILRIRHHRENWSNRPH